MLMNRLFRCMYGYCMNRLSHEMAHLEGKHYSAECNRSWWLWLLEFFLYIKKQHGIHMESGAQWLSGRVLDSRLRGCGFEPHWCHCVVSLSKNINPSLVLVQPRMTYLYITERLLVGRKESNQTSTYGVVIHFTW